MIIETAVELSRWQFAISAMLHFLFIPLTLGLSLLLALMELAYVRTGLVLYKTMARYWGRIFAINFVMAVATRLLLIFQFGMNGSYFAEYAGDVFALPLAIEALTGFFAAVALFGPYWFGWDKLGRVRHLLLTCFITLALHVSAYWVLVGNAWMQNPVGAAFNYQSYRMELTDFDQMISNPVALAKFLHTVAASYAIAMATVLAIAAYRLIKYPADQTARNSYKFAAGLGLLAIIATAGVGDDTSKMNNTVQRAKRAVITGEADNGLLADIEVRIRSGVKAYELLQQLRDDNNDPQLIADFDRFKNDLGYALLLIPLHKQIAGAGDKQIALAAQSALPGSPGIIFWAYRLMIVFGIVCLLWFVSAAWFAGGDKPLPAWLLKCSIYLAPLPWLAAILGWCVAEVGKQPWAIAGVLPISLGVSSQSAMQLGVALAAYVSAFTVLLGVGLFLMRPAATARCLNDIGG